MSANSDRASKDPLLQPFQLKHLTLKNRIISTAHEPGYSEQGLPKLRYQLYHEERAKGGIAACFTGASNISTDSSAGYPNLIVDDDAIIPHFQQLAARMHKHGTAMFCQLAHRGRRDVASHEHWLPSIAPSCVRETSHRTFPKRMELSDFRRVLKAYAAAAQRCVEGHLDGIELEAYGHLIDSFWSPFTNHRKDKYGGSLENRMRFGMEILGAIREAIGTKYIVGLRMVVDEDRPDGLGREEGIEMAKRYAQSGLIDYLNVVKGHIDTDLGLSRMIPGIGTPSAPHLELASAVRASAGIPVMHATRIADVATARFAIAEGHIDLVGMTRAHMTDASIVAKIIRGEEDSIRPCVGAGYCLDSIYRGGVALCIHNPATGRESKLPHVISPASDSRKKAIVVGAGPAGLEAARVLAERGHEVVLFEATSQLGGQIRLAAVNQRRREIIGIVDWLHAELEKLPVDIRFNMLADRQDILAEAPDIVIIATGGLPNTGFLKEGEELVLSSWDVLSGHAPDCKQVLVYDDSSDQAAMDCAEYLCLHSDAKIEIVTPDRVLAQDLGGTNYPPYYRTFYQHDVVITLNHTLLGVRRSDTGLIATLFNAYLGSTIERKFDQVIIEHGTLPMDELYFDLLDESVNQGEVDVEDLLAGRQQSLVNNSEGLYQLFRVGDAVASRNIHAAIYDSLRLCFKL